jgi:queuine tRNA-ribosyltransferase
MIFDDCTSYPAPYEDAKKSMELSLRWAKRSKNAHQSKSALFGIVQGGMYIDLRTQSLESLMGLDFDGMAIGGLSVGETHQERVTIP